MQLLFSIILPLEIFNLNKFNYYIKLCEILRFSRERKADVSPNEITTSIYNCRVRMCNATFNNISVILSVLLVGETRVSGENHQPATSH